LKSQSSNISRIIFFLNTSLEEKDYYRFGVDILKKDLDILFIDFTKYLYPLVKKSTYSRKKNIKDKYITVENQDTLSKTMDLINPKTDHGILFFEYNIKTHRIYKEITKKGLEYSSFMQGTVPVYPRTYKQNYSLLKIIKKIMQGNILKRSLNKYYYKPNIAKKMYNIRSQKYCLLDGEASVSTYSHYSLRDEQTEDLYTHTLDYNYYLHKLKDKTNTRLIKDKYIVLIDAPGPLFIADGLTLGMRASRLTAKIFFPAINNLFKIIEKQFDIKIIIAGHPHSKHDQFPKYFDKREVIYNKTGELIKHSEFVITRGSTAINFAIIYNKPILFYTTKECEMHQDIKDGILSYTSCFNKFPINIDKLNSNHSIRDELNIDPLLYKNYFINYIKTPNTPEENSWLLFKNKLLDN